MSNKILYSILLAAFLTISNAFQCWASTVTVNIGDLRYTVDTDAGTAELYGKKSVSSSITDLVIPDYIEYNDNQYPVTSIRANAFSGSGLKGSITIGNAVTSIGDHAFDILTNLTGSLVIPNSVKYIGECAFRHCDGFNGTLTIGDSVEIIGEDAFQFCQFTGSLIIPNSVKEIKTGAFHECTKFNSLMIGESVETIGDYAFGVCLNMTGTLKIPNSVIFVGKKAFWGDNGFNELIIGNQVQTIGVSAFEDCSNLTGSLIIPASVQTIGESAFDRCSNLTGSLIIPASVQEIGPNAFRSTSSLTSLLIESQNITIHGGAFIRYGGALSSITCLATTPPPCIYDGYAGGSIFFSYDTPLYVPAQSVELYKQATEWKKFKYIYPISIAATSLSLNKTELELSIGGEETLEATILPEEASNTELTWTSSDPSVASVDQSGAVTALSLGKTTITVTTENDLSATCKVTVIPIPATSITLNVENMTLLVGESDQLKAAIEPVNVTDATVTWSSDNTAIATVAADGTVTGVSVGTATITATCGDVSATCRVTVNPIAASDITINVEDLTLLVGQTDKLSATVLPENTTDKTVTWKSDNESVATVGADGTVTGVSVGVANITASCGDVSATCKVTVNPIAASDITINVEDLTLLVGQTDKLSATVLPENTTDKTVTWKSDNESVATVGADGTVTGVSVGVANISATCGEVSATCRVTVITKALAPIQLLRKGDGTSNTFVAMMEQDDKTLEGGGYRYVFGYDNLSGDSQVIEDSPWRYTHIDSEIYWNNTNDFWVFAYYIDQDGTVCVSSRRHLDGTLDSNFNPQDFIGRYSRNGEHILGIYTIQGQYIGKDIDSLASGMYIVKTTNSSYKIVK